MAQRRVWAEILPGVEEVEGQVKHSAFQRNRRKEITKRERLDTSVLSILNTSKVPVTTKCPSEEFFFFV